MKSLYLGLFFILAAFASSAQIQIQVTEGSETFSNGSHNCLMVTIYQHPAKEVEKEFKSELKDLKGKVSSKKNELFGDDCEHKSMGDNTFDVYARPIAKKPGEVVLAVAVDLGGAYLNSRDHPDKYKAMQRILHDFGVKSTKSAISAQLKEEEKVLEKLEKEQKDLVRDNENYHKSIEDNQKRIEQAKADIEQAKKDIEMNKANQDQKKQAISDQQQRISDVEKKMSGVK